MCTGHSGGKGHVEAAVTSGGDASAAGSVGGCVAIGRKNVTLLPLTLRALPALSFSHTFLLSSLTDPSLFLQCSLLPERLWVNLA